MENSSRICELTDPISGTYVVLNILYVVVIPQIECTFGTSLLTCGFKHIETIYELALNMLLNNKYE